MTMLDAYAALGWRVHPLHDVTTGSCSCGAACGKNAGKHPRLSAWQRVATTDKATIAAWRQRWPGANLGIATGAASNVIVLDVDGDQGAESLRTLELQHGMLPETVVSLTGRGGRHYLFRHPGGSVPNAVGRWPGLDLRGDGGYIVAPPSRTVGLYAWQIGNDPEAVPLAAAPAWLLAAETDTSARDQRPPEAMDRLRTDGTPLVLREGSRNARLFQIGSALRRYGCGEQALRGALAVVNREHSVPPLEAGEVAKIAASATRYAPPARCGACGAPLPQDESNVAAALDEDALVARALGVVLR